MRKFIFIFIFLLASQYSYASNVEFYVVEKTDGTVAIIHYLTGSFDSIQDVIRDLGYEARPIEKVNKGDLPPTQTDRLYWKMNPSPMGNRVIVDNVKKQLAEDARNAKNNTRKTARQKMCPTCTDQDFEEAFGES